MNEATMILKMFDEGKITLEEAEALLEVLGTDTTTTVNESFPTAARPVSEWKAPASEKRREPSDDDDYTDSDEIDELVDHIEETFDQMEDKINEIDDELDDELDSLQDEWEELEDTDGVDSTRKEELRAKMETARQRAEARREELRKERKRIREQEKEYKRQVRYHHGISEEIEAGMRELSRGLDEVRRNFEREAIPELRGAIRQLSEELNEGMSGLRHGLNEGAREIRRTFGSNSFRNLFNGIFNSFNWSDTGIHIDEEIRGSFELTAGPVEIDLRTHNGKIEVYGTNEDEYRLELHYSIPAESEEEARRLKEEMITITQETNVLRVKTLEYRRGGVYLRFFLPKATEGNIKLQTSNGKIIAEELRSKGRLQIDTSNGGILLKSIRVKELKAETSNGRVELCDVASDRMDVETSNGGILVEGICENVNCRTSNGTISAYPYVMNKGKLKLSTSNGRIKVVLKNLDMGVDMEASTTMGSITLDIPQLEYERRYEKHNRSDFKAHTKGYAEMEKQLRIEATTSMGSIYIGQNNE